MSPARRIPGFLYVWAHRAANRFYDLRATAAGYCNHSPHSPIPGQGGGYADWRCALRRGHRGTHRSRNYIWTADGHTRYAPVPAGKAMPAQPWRRHMTMTRRDQRARDWWHAEQSARRGIRTAQWWYRRSKREARHATWRSLRELVRH